MENENKVNRLAELANKVRKTFAYRKAKLISDFTESFSAMMVRRGVKRAELARRIGAAVCDANSPGVDELHL